MKHFKRILTIALCVVILSVSVGTKWFDSNHMEKVSATEAVTAAALSAAAMYAICYYVGTLAYMSAPIESASLPDKQVAYTGYCTLRKAYIGTSNPAIANSPVLTFIDKAGQPYVYGSEALQEVAETEFKVILGGKMPGDDDNDDDNEEEEIDTTVDDKSGIVDNVVHMYGNAKELGAAVSIGFATMITKLFGDEYDKYLDGEDSIYTPLDEIYTFSDFTYTEDGQIHCIWNGSWSTLDGGYCLAYGEQNIDGLVVVAPSDGTGNFSYLQYVNGQFNTISHLLNYKFYYPNGEFSHSVVSSDSTWRPNIIGSCSFNVPLYNSKDEAIKALQNGKFSDALNYEKTYRIGDWLQDDWSGELLDPYTGLHALGDMYNIARHQGLNALGNTINFKDFTDFLRDYFGELGTSNLPEVNPGLPIIEYPQVNDWKYEFHPTPGVPLVIDPVIDPVNPPVIDPVDPPVIDPVDPPVIDPVDPPVIDPVDPPEDDPVDPPEDDPKDEKDPESGSFVADLSKFFPFCIPFDLIHLLSVLDAEPETPRWEIPFKIPAYGVDETIVIDLSAFDGVAKIVRLCETILFIFSLILATRGLIKG